MKRYNIPGCLVLLLVVIAIVITGAISIKHHAGKRCKYRYAIRVYEPVFLGFRRYDYYLCQSYVVDSGGLKLFDCSEGSEFMISNPWRADIEENICSRFSGVKEH